jgi:hypothetical protein
MIPHCGRGAEESGVKPPHSKARSARKNIGLIRVHSWLNPV